MQGEYSLLVDVASAWIEVDSVEGIQECLLTAARWGCPQSDQTDYPKPFSTPPKSKNYAPLPAFEIVAVKNRLNPLFDARHFSAGYRDLFLYLRLLQSRYLCPYDITCSFMCVWYALTCLTIRSNICTLIRYPTHVVELQLRLKQFTDPIRSGSRKSEMTGESDYWPMRIFQMSKALNIFDMNLRRHIGPMTQESAQLLRDGLVSSVQLDHFPWGSAGGPLLIDAVDGCSLGTLTSVSIHNCGASDADFLSLVDGLRRHPRLRSLRASGSTLTPGELLVVPWERIAQHRALTELDLSFNRLSGPLPIYLSNSLPTCLQKLILHANNLQGHIPPDIGCLAALEHLVLSRNQVTSTTHVLLF